jgi:hypothetical protein
MSRRTRRNVGARSENPSPKEEAMSTEEKPTVTPDDLASFGAALRAKGAEVTARQEAEVALNSYNAAYAAVRAGRVDRAEANGDVVERVVATDGSSAIITYGIKDTAEEIESARRFALDELNKGAVTRAKRKQAESASARVTHRMRIASDIAAMLMTRVDPAERLSVLELARAALPVCDR